MDVIRSQTRNSLLCGNCPDWLKLEYTSLFEESIDGVNVRIGELPMLVCPTCSQTYFTLMTLVLLSRMVEDAQAESKNLVYITKIANKTRFSYCQQIDFKYDATDYSHIPGLARPQRDGALTPVFFKKEVLHHFRSYPNYRVEHVSDTYGTIYHNDWPIPYGITRSNKVICWLYDLDKLDKNVQQIFKAFNIESDHDIASHFYAAQIGAEFTPITPTYSLFIQIGQINQLTQSKFCFKLFKKPDFARHESASKPIFWDKDNVLPVVNSLHQVCIESVKVQELKSEIKKKDPEFDFNGLRSLKLLTKWIQLCCPNLDSLSITKPLFVLYDFRQILEHDTGSDEAAILEGCYERMAVSERNFENLYDSIVKGISHSFDEIIKALGE